MKRYYMRYESDRTVCKSNDHTWGYANSLKTAKQYISKCRRSEKDDNPRNFRIYDTQSSGEYAECVYREE